MSDMEAGLLHMRYLKGGQRFSFTPGFLARVGEVQRVPPHMLKEFVFVPSEGIPFVTSKLPGRAQNTLTFMAEGAKVKPNEMLAALALEHLVECRLADHVGESMKNIPVIHGSGFMVWTGLCAAALISGYASVNWYLAAVVGAYTPVCEEMIGA